VINSNVQGIQYCQSDTNRDQQLQLAAMEERPTKHIIGYIRDEFLQVK